MSYMYVTNELNVDKNLTNPKGLNLRLPITLGRNMVISFKPLDYWLYMFKHRVRCGRAAQYLGGSSDFVTNSYGESWDSFCEKSWVQIHNQ